MVEIEPTEDLSSGESEDEVEEQETNENGKESGIPEVDDGEEESDSEVKLDADADADAASTASHSSVEMTNGSTHFSFPLPPSAPAHRRDDGPPPQTQEHGQWMYNSLPEDTFVRYRCAGWIKPCGAVIDLSLQESIRCKECGCRGVYKMRTKRMVQFEAR